MSDMNRDRRGFGKAPGNLAQLIADRYPKAGEIPSWIHEQLGSEDDSARGDYTGRIAAATRDSTDAAEVTDLSGQAEREKQKTLNPQAGDYTEAGIAAIDNARSFYLSQGLTSPYEQ